VQAYPGNVLAASGHLNKEAILQGMAQRQLCEPGCEASFCICSTLVWRTRTTYPLVCRMHILQRRQSQLPPEVWQQPLQGGLRLCQCLCLLVHGDTPHQVPVYEEDNY
jgi:hypothetical protein